MYISKKKNDWYKLLERKLIDAQSYKNYCNLLKKVLKLAEEEYTRNKLDSLGSDIKKTGPS